MPYSESFNQPDLLEIHHDIQLTDRTISIREILIDIAFGE